MAKKGSQKGARAKLRAYLLENVGRVIEGEILREVSGNISEWARRVRELRDEEGMNIVTHNDRSELKPGQYMLVNTMLRPALERDISKELRALVLTRDGGVCQLCGAAAGEPHPDDHSRLTRLHVGHVVDKSMGGIDDLSNLRAICSVCNEGAANITPNPSQFIKLKAQIRKASNADQLEILKWLVEKFPMYAEEYLEPFE